MPESHQSSHVPPWALLVNILTKSIESNEFKPDKFFLHWFREYGHPYFFLFKKNLSVTNISHPELFSLIRQHLYITSTRHHAHEPLFHTTAAFTQAIQSIVRPIVERLQFTPQDLWKTAELYWPILEQSVIVTQFFTSCAVLLPPHLDLDVLNICAESGYVYDCGHSLFVRKISKATELHFFEAIDRHLIRYPDYQGKLQFVPFSREDFADDQNVAYMQDAMQNGIEGVKMRVEKLHMRNTSLPQVFRHMEERYKGRLIFREAGPYRKMHPESSDTTLWLITDRSVNNANPTTPGGESYYICYQELYYNDSPFHVFDENKPAWTAHNTIPHTLLGAMINITKPWSSDKETVIQDPFAGTGTTWLECEKYQRIRCIASDINPLFPTLLEDNIAFFSMSQLELADYIGQLRQLLVILVPLASRHSTESGDGDLLIDVGDLRFPPVYRVAVELVDQLSVGKVRPILSFDFSPDIAARIRSFSFFGRLVFYLALRAELQYQSAIIRGATGRVAGFVKAAKYLIGEIESSLEWHGRAVHSVEASKTFSLFPGHYAKSCGIGGSRLRESRDKARAHEDIGVCDARLLKEASCDVLVTDPPYGFNTEEGLMELAELYGEVILAMVAAVRDDGHIVLCLPSKTFSGRPLPTCTASQIVTAQVLRSADRLGKAVYSPSRSRLPMSVPPYYWVSQALQRSILHFRIRDRH